jgi:hypothetical protein
LVRLAVFYGAYAKLCLEGLETCDSPEQRMVTNLIFFPCAIPYVVCIILKRIWLTIMAFYMGYGHRQLLLFYSDASIDIQPEPVVFCGSTCGALSIAK